MVRRSTRINRKKSDAVRVSRHRRVSRQPDAADRFENANRESRIQNDHSRSITGRKRVYFSDNRDPFAEKKKKILNFFRGLLATATVTDRGRKSGKLKE